MPPFLSLGYFVGYVISVPIVYALLGSLGLNVVDRKDLHVSFMRAFVALLVSVAWPFVLPLGVITFLVALLFSRLGI